MISFGRLIYATGLEKQIPVLIKQDVEEIKPWDTLSKGKV